MLWNIQKLRGFGLRATDGNIGAIKDVLFDEVEWMIRHLVVDTGGWLSGRHVLIAPAALGPPDDDRHEFPVSLTKEQIKNSPDIDTDKPVSRRHELDLYRYYGWMPYWGASPPVVPGLAGYAPGMIPPSQNVPETEEESGDPLLRSAREVEGYGIAATDGSVGPVEDFLIDLKDWKVSYLVVDTRNWLLGKKIVISTGWIWRISWNDREVAVRLCRDEIKNGPAYDPAIGIDRDYETKLYGQHA